MTSHQRPPPLAQGLMLSVSAISRYSSGLRSASRLSPKNHFVLAFGTRFSVLQGLQTFYLNRAELQLARELGEQLLSLAHRLDDSVSLIGAHGTCGVTDYFVGALPAARRYLEQSIGLHNAQQHRMATPS